MSAVVLFESAIQKQSIIMLSAVCDSQKKGVGIKGQPTEGGSRAGMQETR